MDGTLTSPSTARHQWSAGKHFLDGGLLNTLFKTIKKPKASKVKNELYQKNLW